jgi:Uma2 family endonuclease
VTEGAWHDLDVSSVEKEFVSIPVDALLLPMELRPPDGFDPDDLDTWPDLDGSLEYVDGRLLYMPPGGERQGVTLTDVGFVLASWQRQQPELEVCTGDIGIRLGADIRGADAAVWRTADLGPVTAGALTLPPILAVEVCGRFQAEADLREKAKWYLEHGVRIVWIVLPREREVVVLEGDRETRYRRGDTIAEVAELPGLRARVDDLFIQLDRSAR